MSGSPASELRRERGAVLGQEAEQRAPEAACVPRREPVSMEHRSPGDPHLDRVVERSPGDPHLDWWWSTGAPETRIWTGWWSTEPGDPHLDRVVEHRSPGDPHLDRAVEQWLSWDRGLYSYLLRCCSDVSSRGVVVGFDTRGQQESGCSSSRDSETGTGGQRDSETRTGGQRDMRQRDSETGTVRRGQGDSETVRRDSETGTVRRGQGDSETERQLARLVAAVLLSRRVPVYWCNGAQICSPHDKEIVRSIEEELQPWSASCWAEEEVQFVHSSFHGVGHVFVQKAFEAFGFVPPLAVPEQKDPDPESFLSSWQSGKMLTSFWRRIPTPTGSLRQSDVFSGNELAALLGWWMFLHWKEAHPDPADLQKLFMISTTVSSKILQALARIEGFHFEETLPGFKWIGNRIHELSKAGNSVIFAFEESIGFLCGGSIPDKDGVSAAAVVAEMATFLHNKSLNLNQQLLNIYHTYGPHLSQTSYVICDDPPTVSRIFHRLRNFHGEDSYPQRCGGVRVANVRDVTTGYDSSRADRTCVLPVTRSGHMITFTLQNGVVATLRTSGTEPKIKYYTEYCAAPGTRRRLCRESWTGSPRAADDFLEPEKNNLIRRCV
ncbi:hypothetical protein F7725_027055 [Dissostichus mawsoni]|uniref:Alpha-D-phosphohexomutase alpha/beta/alpha domain-containing protein n=1 Tax=Dissostichus mawsoni TaxID=36200 RepID=A0A7J5XD49_DISMA|nr:hypothetical protein F7725_027055 [Dissostichus mawsoni]